MAFKAVFYCPAGGQGKTFSSLEIAIALARLGYKVFLSGCCFSNQMTLFLNTKENIILNPEEQFLFEVPGLDALLEGRPLGELLLEVRDNLHFLPGGNLPEAEYILRTKASKRLEKQVSILEEYLTECDAFYDFMFFDMAPNHNTHLFYNLVYFADSIVSPVETKKRGVPLLKLFRRYLEQKNPMIREKYGKEPISVDLVIPNRHHPSYKIHQEVLGNLQSIFGKDSVTEPIEECTSIGRAWEEGESLKEYISTQVKRKLRKNEETSLRVLDDIAQSFVTLAEEKGCISATKPVATAVS